MARKCVGDFLRRQCQKRTLVLHKARIVSSSSDNAEVGPEATKRFFEFFTVPIPQQEHSDRVLPSDRQIPVRERKFLSRE
jgi:hypothetical protein